MVLFIMTITVMAQTQEEKVARYRAAERDIKAAVEAGEVSKEAAERRLIEMRMRMFEQPGAEARNARTKWVEGYFKGAEDALVSAVKSGKLDRKEIEPILLGLRKDMQVRLDEGKKSSEEKGRNANPEEGMRAYLDKVQKEVDEAVKAGKMTKKEGKKKIEEAQKAVDERRKAMEKRGR